MLALLRYQRLLVGAYASVIDQSDNYIELIASPIIDTMRALSLLNIWLLLFCFPCYGETGHSGPSLALTRSLTVSIAEFWPYTYSDEDGKVEGDAVALLRATLGRLNMPYQIDFRPPARIYHQLKVGEVDVWIGVLDIPSLKQHVWAVALPEEFNIELFLWHRPETVEARDLSGLKGQSLAVINGYTYKGFIDELAAPHNRIRLYSSSGHESALRMLISGRADYLLDYRRPIEVLLQDYPEVTLMKYHIRSRQLGFLVSRKASQSLSLFDALKQAVEKQTLVE
jgi:polar amino acid transport system substrate-binding protein